MERWCGKWDGEDDSCSAADLYSPRAPSAAAPIRACQNRKRTTTTTHRIRKDSPHPPTALNFARLRKNLSGEYKL